MSTFHPPTRKTEMSCLVDGNKLTRWICAAVLMLAAPLSAQTDSVARWPIGSRVRVWTSADHKFVGYLREIRGDTLLLVAPGASRVQRKTLADSVSRLEVSEGRTFSATNIALGALGGAAVTTGLVWLLSGGDADCTVGGRCGPEVPYRDAALIGAAIGAVAGVFVLKEEWRGVRVPGRMSVVPRPGQTAVALSFNFR
jgi:hypothetical protein